MSVCFRLLGNVEDAKDLAQETFVQGYLGLKTFRADSRFSTWIYRIAVNLCLTTLRRRPPIAELLEPSVPDSGPTPHDALARRERARSANRALERLSPDLRVAVVLRDMLGFSYAEIAAACDVPLGTVKSRISAARVALRRLLEGTDEL